ncbi:MAG: hypothetical protein PHX16_05540 [Syntrophaceticus sp.]|nr:hypothetical protein [Syntrophaceticus sp.]MDD3315446.1 hypothetical protein [Syntrophaceticus sp.]MDD4359430.1 hypothetical protein [Syntrophaceticus sp.]MDD4783083.1 hypothetical protein [Syntrophaceticus sp.]
MAVDQNALQILNSFRPYLGPQGNKISDLLDGLLDLLFSEPVQNYFITMQDSIGINIPGFLLEEEERKVNPFTLFLILILLILSDFGNMPGTEMAVRLGERRST